ncbi:cbb3-type cytochrome c oxidase subunit I [Calditerrivibrio sp.]|jgi:cytochrome c oxidase cbb3-type subunit 1|uniref:cbb3-type cytochrome c oxidase subunit I n=1 Tax=Calditerrivibrio sp. TaxID=2792612 RepID=UPI003D12A7BE
MNEYQYDYQTVKGFIVSCLFWGVIGLVIGLLISAQLWNPNFNFGEYFSFGRLRTVHTNVLAYGLGIGAEFGIFYYLVIRLTKRPLLFPKLARFHLWLFNVGIALAAWTLFMGYSQNLEYAEFEWPIDIAVVILWVIFAINVMGTIFKRKEEELYISLWYIIATIVTVAILYIVNNLSIPATLFKSYHLFAGVNSANVEWWYGHNAVGFLFTTPILAMFYYFLPKSTGLPIYSHRLSIISFWSLIFAYLWTGAHHLVYTPLPDWIQTLGIAFTLFLIAPSWGSVVNGYFTVESDWSVMKNKYLTKFFIAGITFYGLQTIQGPSQGIRVISSLIHYTDWVPGHVHMGTMGWVTMVICASIYYIIPHIYKTEIYSVKLANIHFWIVLIGQLMFSITMWITGIQQGAMWKMTNPDGSLKYTFIETVTANYPYWQMRTIAGIIFVIGMLFFLYNVFMTIQKGKKELAAKLAAANA